MNKNKNGNSNSTLNHSVYNLFIGHKILSLLLSLYFIIFQGKNLFTSRQVSSRPFEFSLQNQYTDRIQKFTESDESISSQI